MIAPETNPIAYDINFPPPDLELGPERVRRNVASGGGCFGGAREDRTPDLSHAMRTLSRLSYGPLWSRVEQGPTIGPCQLS